ncbi:MAG: hypothetical protein HZB23_06040 [Deltaproteobacteria bacterium]|nr:hypothetical protein [Deltaproteobacteria bacterium]
MEEMQTTQTSPKPFCFVLMPFDKSFDDIYEYGIKGACEEVGVYCERVDEQIFPGSMLDRIYNQISRADIIVADMTARNPNVFYEVGYAHALGKVVILLTQRAEDIPFDLKHFLHIVYNSQIKELRPELAKRIKHFAFEADRTVRTEIGLEIFHETQPLASGCVIVKRGQNQRPNIKISIYNSSSITYNPGDFRLGIISTPPVNHAYCIKHSTSIPMVDSTKLPTGQYLHVFPEFEKLFPGGYCSAHFGLNTKGANWPDCVDLILRIFTSVGCRDFLLRMEDERP